MSPLSRAKFKLSLRAKVMTLLTVAITFSLFSYLYVGMSLFTEDKTSYIYDYNLTWIKSVADGLQNQVSKAAVVAASTARLIGSKGVNDGVVEAAYKSLSSRYGVTALIYLRPSDGRRFASIKEFGAGADQLKRLTAESGWTPAEVARIGEDESLFGKASRGLLPVAGRSVDSAGDPVAFVMLMELKKALVEPPSKHFKVFLTDSAGGAETPAAIKPAIGAIPAGLDSGVREMPIEGADSIVAYQRLAGGRLTLLGIIARNVAFETLHALVLRSFALGLSVLLFALGVALVFAKNLTERLRQMWLATQKVSQGDFSVRIGTDGAEDEVTSLAISFNSMSDRIDELMVETAQKARMEKEIETAQIVQSRFFPTSSLDHDNLKLFGRFVPASECSGDWWQYAVLGDQVILVIGDVTGHGVSAAFVTAAAHATFSRWVSEASRKLPETPPSLDELLERLNHAVLTTAAGTANMTFIASFIDLKTGSLTSINAGHPHPYLYRPAAKADARVTAIMGDKLNPPIGEKAGYSAKSHVVQLQPGDRIFWYTDGVFEERASDRKKIRKLGFIRSLEEIAERSGFNAKSICENYMNQAMEFFGKDEERPDDITFVVVAVPKNAEFAAAAKEAA